jgi:hypothetical protein
MLLTPAAGGGTVACIRERETERIRSGPTHAWARTASKPNGCRARELIAALESLKYISAVFRSLEKCTMHSPSH